MKPKTVVSKGAKLLDEKLPGWAKKIKVDKLDLESNKNCILGQLFKGDCYTGLVKLGFPDNPAGGSHDHEKQDKAAEKHGFMAAETDASEYNDLWKQEIETRVPKKSKKG